LTTHLYLVLRLWVNGAVPLLSLYVFMAWTVTTSSVTTVNLFVHKISAPNSCEIIIITRERCWTYIKIYILCVVPCIVGFVLFYVLLVLCRSLYCLCVHVLPDVYPIAVKYIISYHNCIS
jgi:hypothetical protein